MAPIQTSSSVHTSSSTLPQNKCCCGGGASNSLLMVPITRRGLFFQDSFFEQARAHFDTAVKQVLSRWSDTDFSVSSNLDRYRQLRSSNLKEENQAVSSTTDNTCLKIVMDVKEFLEGDIRVKVVGDKELVVEGRLEDNLKGTSSLTCQSFRRHFSLPDFTNVYEITSVMSSDGILTITAPKKVDRVKEDVMISSNVSDTQRGSSRNSSNTFVQKSSPPAGTHASGANPSSISNSNLKNTKEDDHCECCKKNLLQEQTVTSKLYQENGVKVPIKINASLTTTSNCSANQEYDETTAYSANTTTQKNDGIQNKKADEQPEEQTNKSSDAVLDSKVREMIDNRSAESQNNNVRRSYEVPVGTPNVLPVTRRGMFFSDSFFEDVRQDFQAAVKEVLSKWGETSSASTFDDLTSYRKLRSRDLCEENQAVKSTEDEHNHKFVLDVQDFLDGGEINVQAVNDRELVIEGRVEKQEGNAKSTKQFCRSFRLPRNIKLESVTSVVSADGVLTITAPKKPPTFQLKEIQASETKVNVSLKSETHRESSEKETTGTDEHLRGANTSSSVGIIGSEANKVMSEESLGSTRIMNEGLEKTHESCGSSVNRNTEALAFSSSLKNQYPSKETSTVSSDAKQTTSDQMRQQKEHIIPVQVEVEDQITEAEKEISCKNNFDSCDQSSATSQSKKINNTEDITVEQEMLKRNNTSVDDKENIDIILTRHDKQSQVKQQEDQDLVNGHSDVNCLNKEGFSARNVSCSSSRADVPITRRGLFFQDSLFQDSLENFEAAVKDVLDKFSVRSSQQDDLTIYRNLRLHELKTENQAFHVEDTKSSHKVVLDVQDFLGGEIKVGISEDRELVIEGQAERKEGTASASISFLRRFLLPTAADVNGVNAVVSADGVLTVISPKREISSSCGPLKTSTESKSRVESQSDSGRSWEEKSRQESSEESQGYKSHKVSSSYKARHQHSSTKLL